MLAVFPLPRTFQSTPPVRGATIQGYDIYLSGPHFNPRPPCGGRLKWQEAVNDANAISIHAPRAGGDWDYT